MSQRQSSWSVFTTLLAMLALCAVLIGLLTALVLSGAKAQGEELPAPAANSVGPLYCRVLITTDGKTTDSLYQDDRVFSVSSDYDCPPEILVRNRQSQVEFIRLTVHTRHVLIPLCRLGTIELCPVTDAYKH